MKLSILGTAFFMITLFAFSSCEKSSDIIDQENENILTEVEESDLLFMREEEKLARDVYLYLYDKYDQLIFKNISGSEQKHMDALITLLDQYNLEDPIIDQNGIFSNEALQGLYDDLILKGDLSLENALLVGASIEDLDIRDIQVAIDKTSKTDIKEVYEKLICGSKNHMRAFDGKLKDIGASYTPQYLSQEQYDLIISGQHAHCN
ncbi:DUF2202 domain-containing protein [Portibacter lacus]|uniref:DUF2202 domain-containing protein n=1 Tax=Portibacter lacus TaxID=1099794 RepID=A0AA37STA8_9BACT|nr:DUF2202 domain-containing protein [Portibacter lacus]GLR17615.1 hypothetical protein GCM10007940_22300 [Portibacter lacus]